MLPTPDRADNNLDLSIERRTKLPVWLHGHIWHGDSPAARLRHARVAKGMTIRDLAKAAGMTREAISIIEAGKTTPSLPTLRKLAQILNVPIAYLGCFDNLPEDTLGQRIIKARLCQGFTKKEFAQLLGVDVKTLRSWEQDKRKPQPKHLKALKEILIISMLTNKKLGKR